MIYNMCHHLTFIYNTQKTDGNLTLIYNMHEADDHLTLIFYNTQD